MSHKTVGELKEALEEIRVELDQLASKKTSILMRTSMLLRERQRLQMHLEALEHPRHRPGSSRIDVPGRGVS